MKTLFARLTLRVNHDGGKKLSESVPIRAHPWLNYFCRVKLDWRRGC